MYLKVHLNSCKKILIFKLFCLTVMFPGVVLSQEVVPWENKTCSTLGSYPAIPDLTSYPDGFATKYNTVVPQAELISGNWGDQARVDINNYNAIMNVAQKNIFEIREAFWKKYDSGTLDKTLKNEYAFWLAIITDNQTVMTGSSNPIAAILGNMMQAQMNGYVDAADSTYQYLIHSRCSPIKSTDREHAYSVAGFSWLGHFVNNVYPLKNTNLRIVFPLIYPEIGLQDYFNKWYEGLTPPLEDWIIFYKTFFDEKPNAEFKEYIRGKMSAVNYPPKEN